MIAVTVFLSILNQMELNLVGFLFSFNFEPNGIPFGSKSKEILSLRSYSIKFESKWKSMFLIQVLLTLTPLSPFFNTLKVLEKKGEKGVSLKVLKKR